MTIFLFSSSVLSSIFPESFLHFLYKFGGNIEYITNGGNREVFFQHIFRGGEIFLFYPFFTPLLTPFFYSDLNSFFFTGFSQPISQGQYFCFHLRRYFFCNGV